MYVSSLRNRINNNDFQLGDKICVIEKDYGTNNPDYVDGNAIFTTDGTLSWDLSDKGILVYKEEFFQFHLDKITLPNKPEPDSYMKYALNGEIATKKSIIY